MVNKDDFVNAYKKFPPGRSEFFYMKYISIHNLHNNRFIELLIILGLFLPFISEIIFYTLNFSTTYKLIPNLIYIFIFTVFGIYWSIISYKRLKRFNKIRKYLGISKSEYKQLVDAYFYHRYPSTKEYLKFNCKSKNDDKNNIKRC